MWEERFAADWHHMDASGDAELHGLLLGLPADVLHHFFSVASPRLLAVVSCCCRAVRDELKACDWVWREHCQHTWQTWSQQACSAANDGRASWRSLYAARKAVRMQRTYACNSALISGSAGLKMTLLTLFMLTELGMLCCRWSARP